MTPAEEVDLFSRLPANQFEVWLTEQHNDSVRYLTSSLDMAIVHRAQGKALFIEEMKKLLAKAKGLR